LGVYVGLVLKALVTLHAASTRTDEAFRVLGMMGFQLRLAIGYAALATLPVLQNSTLADTSKVRRGASST
jgi:hypothetical protein